MKRARLVQIKRGHMRGLFDPPEPEPVEPEPQATAATVAPAAGELPAVVEILEVSSPFERITEVLARMPALIGHYIAYVVGKPGTAQIAGDARTAWRRLEGEQDPAQIVPADAATRAHLGIP